MSIGVRPAFWDSHAMKRLASRPRIGLAFFWNRGLGCGRPPVTMRFRAHHIRFVGMRMRIDLSEESRIS